MKNKLSMLGLAALMIGFNLARGDDATPPVNVLPNGGFENWTDWTAPTGPKDIHFTVPGGRVPLGCSYDVEAYEHDKDPTFPVTVTISRDGDIKHGGDYSLKVQNNSVTDIGGILFGPIGVFPNTTYTLKFWYKGEDIVPNSKPGDGVGVIFWTNEAPTSELWKDETINGFTPGLKSGTFDWQSYEITITTKNTTHMLAVAGQLRRAQGTAWFDDFQMTMVPAAATPSPSATTNAAP